MPIIGHTLAGIAIAQQFEPAGSGGSGAPGPVARALWMPMVVAISYLPDVATQAGVWMGSESAQQIGHSIPFGLVAGAIIGVVWAAMGGGPARLLAILAAGAIGLHDVMDLLQDAERVPFWPLSSREMGVHWFAFENRLWGEALVFGVPFLIYETWRVVRGRRTTDKNPTSNQTAWVGRGLVLVVLLSALTVLELRGERERQMVEAGALRRSGKFTEALALLDLAERWPSSQGAGDITRGEIYDRMGDAARAEAAFLRAHRRDPGEFWPVAVLAAHYASHGTAAERRQRSAPYVDRLRREFSGHEAFRSVMDRIERDLLKAP